MEDDEVRIYLLRTQEQTDDEGAPLWWSQGGGWGHLADAQVFMPDEIHTKNLATTGPWRSEFVEFTNKVRD